MVMERKYFLEEKQLSFWDLSPNTSELTLDQIEQESVVEKSSAGFQLGFPVGNHNFSLSSIDFVKIVLIDDEGRQDAILFITQSKEGIFHLIFFEKMSPERQNPRRLEIILEANGYNYQRVGNTHHWETDPDIQYDLEEWQNIMLMAAMQKLEPKNQFVVESLRRLLANNCIVAQQI